MATDTVNALWNWVHALLLRRFLLLCLAAGSAGTWDCSAQGLLVRVDSVVVISRQRSFPVVCKDVLGLLKLAVKMHLSLRHSSLRVVIWLYLYQAVLVRLWWQSIHLFQVALRIHEVVRLGMRSLCWVLLVGCAFVSPFSGCTCYLLRLLVFLFLHVSDSQVRIDSWYYFNYY